jgi:hypothetical protein
MVSSHLVPHWVYCHLHYGAGMRVAKLQLGKVRTPVVL